MQIGLWLLGKYGKRLFCATPQSLPQYYHSPKKVVTGHGIDLHYWPKRVNHSTNPQALLGVMRLSRSKRIELGVQALALLPETFTWDIYGIPAEPAYVQEIMALITELKLEHRVRIHASVLSKDLPALYQSHRFSLNMASETIDKTMLEAMTCGCMPITTHGNSNAIGLVYSPVNENPAVIAAFIQECIKDAPVSADALYEIIKTRHSLEKIIETMDSYIRSGQ